MRFLLRDSRLADASCPHSNGSTTPAWRRAANWLLAGAGLLSLGIGIVGIWVPGLPTTIFLIIASWLFTRSCPAVDRWMRSLGPVQPFLRFVDGAAIPAGRTLWIVTVIWAGSLWGALAASQPLASITIVAAAVVGTAFVVRRSEWMATAASASASDVSNG